MLSFRTIGVGESAIVEMIAEFVKFPEVKVAYRASAPYIEIKFFSESNHENLLQEIYSNCLGVLKDFVYEEDGENWIKDFGKLVLESKIPVCLSDSFTGGLVMTEVSSQLFKLGRHPGDLNLLTLWDNSTDSKTWVQECLAWGEEDQVSLAVAADSSLNWTAGVFINGRRLLETKPLPYQVTSQSVRNEKAVAYLTIKQWTKQWRDSESVVH
jgi:hypothetical protein